LFADAGGCLTIAATAAAAEGVSIFVTEATGVFVLLTIGDFGFTWFA